MVGDLPEIIKFPPIFQFFSKTFEQSGDLFDFLPKVLTFRYWLKIIYLFKDLNSSASSSPLELCINFEEQNPSAKCTEHEKICFETSICTRFT